MNARERFERTRKAVNRLAEVHALIMNDCDDWKPPSVKAPGIGDPTAARAIKNVDVIAEKLTALRKEEEELTAFIGETLRIIEAVRTGFGEIYATLLEARYIDCFTWTRIHDEKGIPKSTGHYLLDIAYDWIDSVGVSRLLWGDSEL